MMGDMQQADSALNQALTPVQISSVKCLGLGLGLGFLGPMIPDQRSGALAAGILGGYLHECSECIADLKPLSV